jgi:hypothetical protein
MQILDTSRDFGRFNDYTFQRCGHWRFYQPDAYSLTTLRHKYQIYPLIGGRCAPALNEDSAGRIPLQVLLISGVAETRTLPAVASAELVVDTSSATWRSSETSRGRPLLPPAAAPELSETCRGNYRQRMAKCAVILHYLFERFFFSKHGHKQIKHINDPYHAETMTQIEHHELMRCQSVECSPQ